MFPPYAIIAGFPPFTAAAIRPKFVPGSASMKPFIKFSVPLLCPVCLVLVSAAAGCCSNPEYESEPGPQGGAPTSARCFENTNPDTVAPVLPLDPMFPPSPTPVVPLPPEQ